MLRAEGRRRITLAEGCRPPGDPLLWPAWVSSRDLVWRWLGCSFPPPACSGDTTREGMLEPLEQARAARLLPLETSPFRLRLGDSRRDIKYLITESPGEGSAQQDWGMCSSLWKERGFIPTVTLLKKSGKIETGWGLDQSELVCADRRRVTSFESR